jgi:hypothetical protein
MVLNFLIITKLQNHLVIAKNDRLLELVSLHVMKLLSKIYLPFQWRPLQLLKILKILLLHLSQPKADLIWLAALAQW